MTIEEWRTVVLRSKTRSSSSIFSNRAHAAHKCALHSEILTRLLVKLHDKMTQVGNCVNRWTKILNAIIEKGKGPMLGKLLIIQLIEADFKILLRTCMWLRNDDRIESDVIISKHNY